MTKIETEIRDIPHKDAGREFLELFYPIHYAIGMQVEAALSNGGELDRHQTVIMWLLRNEGMRNNTPSLRRKEIERCLTLWYDITSSTVSKALRALAKPPHNYIVITEDPNSGREKLVTVTPAGQKYYQGMVENASKFIQLATDRMTDEENAMGIHMFKRISDIFQELRDEGRIDSIAGPEETESPQREVAPPKALKR